MGATMATDPNATTDGAPISARGLSNLLVDSLRENRRLRLHLDLAREKHQGAREALRAAVALLREQDRALDRARAALAAMREENRRLTGHTMGRARIPASAAYGDQAVQ